MNSKYKTPPPRELLIFAIQNQPTKHFNETAYNEMEEGIE
jgi:hypothetical protein